MNCFINFDDNSFCHTNHGTTQLMGEGHESKGFYYLGIILLMSGLKFLSIKLLHD